MQGLCGDARVHSSDVEVEVDSGQTPPEPAAAVASPALDALDGVERRSAKRLEASNRAVADYLRALAERLDRVERSEAEEGHLAPAGAPPQAWHPKKRPSESDKAAATEEHPEAEAEEAKPGPRRESEEDDDPDEQQRPYSDFLSTTQRNLGCVGLHAYGMCRATRQDSSCCVACLALVPAMVVLFLQCLVLHSVGLEALNPTCTNNEDCRAGMWCAPSKGASGYVRTPGTCDDCEWAGRLSDRDYRGLPSKFKADAFNVGFWRPFPVSVQSKDAYTAMHADGLSANESMASAVDHCKAMDAEPERCDFIVNFRSQLKLGSFVVLAFATWFLLTAIVADMDEQAEIAELFESRRRNVGIRWSRKSSLTEEEQVCLSFCGSRLIFSTAALVQHLQKLVLPGMAAYAYASLVLAGPSLRGLPLPVSFILDGIAVFFVYSVDRLIALAILDEHARTVIREAFAGSGVKKETDHKRCTYSFHRFFAACLGILILWEVLATETLMDVLPVFRLDWDAPPALKLNPDPARSCTNVATMLGIATAMVVVFNTLVWSVTKPCQLIFTPVVAVLAMPVLSYVLRQLVYTPVAS